MSHKKHKNTTKSNRPGKKSTFDRLRKHGEIAHEERCRRVRRYPNEIDRVLGLLDIISSRPDLKAEFNLIEPTVSFRNDLKIEFDGTANTITLEEQPRPSGRLDAIAFIAVAVLHDECQKNLAGGFKIQAIQKQVLANRVAKFLGLEELSYKTVDRRLKKLPSWLRKRVRCDRGNGGGRWLDLSRDMKRKSMGK